MWFGGSYITLVQGWDEDCMVRVLSLTNEEPLVVVEASVNAVWEVVGKDGRNSGYGVIREGETALCRGRDQHVDERLFSA